MATAAQTPDPVPPPGESGDDTVMLELGHTEGADTTCLAVTVFDGGVMIGGEVGVSEIAVGVAQPAPMRLPGLGE